MPTKHQYYFRLNNFVVNLKRNGGDRKDNDSVLFTVAINDDEPNYASGISNEPLRIVDSGETELLYDANVYKGSDVNWQIGPLSIDENDMVTIGIAIDNRAYAHDQIGDSINNKIVNAIRDSLKKAIEMGIKAGIDYITLDINKALGGAISDIASKPAGNLIDKLVKSKPNCDGQIVKKEIQLTGGQLLDSTPDTTVNGSSLDTSSLRKFTQIYIHSFRSGQELQTPEDCGLAPDTEVTYSIQRIGDHPSISISPQIPIWKYAHSKQQDLSIWVGEYQNTHPFANNKTLHILLDDFNPQDNSFLVTISKWSDDWNERQFPIKGVRIKITYYSGAVGFPQPASKLHLDKFWQKDDDDFTQGREIIFLYSEKPNAHALQYNETVRILPVGVTTKEVEVHLDTYQRPI